MDKFIIKSLELTNFRNIDHIKYDLTDSCCFAGKNHCGKTNALLAIHWLFTAKLLNGADDDPSLKPNNNHEALVSVKITYDCGDDLEHSITKTLQEKWSRKNGTDITRLTGHETVYYFDEIKVTKVGEALKKLHAIFGFTPTTEHDISGLDMVQGIINPLYLGKILDYKTLRKLITTIIGDVTDEEVFAENPKTLLAKDTLFKYRGNVQDATTYITQQITCAKRSIEIIETQLTPLTQKDDVSTEELTRAQESIKQINEQIELLNENVNPNLTIIKLKEGELAELKKDLNLSVTSDEKEYYRLDSLHKQEANNLQVPINDLKQKIVKIANEINELSKKISDTDNQIFSLEKANIDFEAKINELRVTYITENRKKFTSPSEQHCPNCGAVLNKLSIENELKLFEENKINQLNQISKNAKEIQLEIDNNKKTINELKAVRPELETNLQNLKSAKSAYEEKLKSANSNYEAHLNKKVEFVLSDKTNEIKAKIEKLTNNIAELNNWTPDKSIEESRNNLIKSKEEFDEIIAQHYVYLDAQKQIELLKINKSSLIKNRDEYELIKEALSLFNLTKLKLIDSKIKSNFGEDVSFKLIETNITEGSWTPVCYPLINNSYIPFKDGSRSEQIMTGIKVIEAFKKALNLVNLPILIDEIGELDLTTLSELKKLTQSQIIATRVDDLYSKPTLVNL